MVRVQCMTYNHAPYIEDAMNGFCMQETDFPYVCVIVDDASTDGEPEVIKKYLEKNFDLQDDQFFKEDDTDDYHLIFARHKTNRNCFFGVLLLKYNHFRKKDKKPYFLKWSHAKYVALCEGDDYWSDSSKLQLQVDVLNKHPECSFSSTGSLTRRIDNTYLDRTIREDDSVINIFDISAWERTPVSKTFTLVIRKDAYEAAQSSVRNYESPIDIHFSYHLFKIGKCAYIPKPLAIYRITGKGLWTSLSWERQEYWLYSIYREIYNKNNKDEAVYDRYFNSIIRLIELVGVDDLKLIKEGIKEAKKYKDKKKMLSLALHFALSKFRKKLAIGTRLKKIFAISHS